VRWLGSFNVAEPWRGSGRCFSLCSLAILDPIENGDGAGFGIHAFSCRRIADSSCSAEVAWTTAHLWDLKTCTSLTARPERGKTPFRGVRSRSLLWPYNQWPTPLKHILHVSYLLQPAKTSQLQYGRHAGKCQSPACVRLCYICTPHSGARSVFWSLVAALLLWSLLSNFHLQSFIPFGRFEKYFYPNEHEILLVCHGRRN
jgi:hypothetical protein